MYSFYTPLCYPFHLEGFLHCEKIEKWEVISSIVYQLYHFGHIV